MFALAYGMKAADDYLPSYVFTAFGTLFVTNLVAPAVLPEFNDNSSGIGLAPAPLPSSLEVSPTYAMPLRKH